MNVAYVSDRSRKRQSLKRVRRLIDGSGSSDLSLARGDEKNIVGLHRYVGRL
jgi:hypothetical protein